MVNKPYQPPWWIKNPHSQTCYPCILPYRPLTTIKWDTITLPDGDFLEVGEAGAKDRPIVILLPGLQGSIRSHYMRRTIDFLIKQNYHVFVMHYRGVDGRPNCFAKSYNACDIGDLNYLVKALVALYPQQAMHLVGFSLGGNLVLHYLAKEAHAAIKSAVTISVPFSIEDSVKALAPFYHRYFLWSLLRDVEKKIELGITLPTSHEKIKAATTLYEFDELVTAPMFNFKSASAYYEAASCKNYLVDVKTPTLMIHAADDPFVPPMTIPKSKNFSSDIHFMLSQHGGHLGFVSARFPGEQGYWLQQCIHDYFANL